MQDIEPQEPDGVRHYPLDVTRLYKGQVLSVGELQPILNLSPDDHRWGINLVVLQEKIRKQRCNLGLPMLTTHAHKGELVICDDAEAAAYNRKLSRWGIRRFRKAVRQNVSVDVSKLTAEERKAHELALRKQAMVAAASRGATHRKPPEITGPAVRTTPAMIGAK